MNLMSRRVEGCDDTRLRILLEHAVAMNCCGPAFPGRNNVTSQR